MTSDWVGGSDGGAPLVSIIMANYCGGPFLAAAVCSVFAQTHSRLELVVVDDASTDDSVAILSRLAATDERIRVILRDRNVGVASARNAALDASRGDWIAVVDSDDVLHPRRIELLLAAAGEAGTDMIADDLVPFGAADAGEETLLQSLGIDSNTTVNAADLVRSDIGPQGIGSLGYLKPLIARSRIEGLRYDTRLSVGEDFDFYLRLLLAGPPMHVLPLPLYLYRRHTASLSHRLSEDALAAIIASNDDLIAKADVREVSKAADRRGQELRRALRYERLVSAIKARAWFVAAKVLMRHPQLFMPLCESVSDRRRRKRAIEIAGNGERARTVVLGTRSALDFIDAPSDAIFMHTEPLSVSAEDAPAKHRVLASKLNTWSAQGPLHLIAVGSESVDALGFVATWDRAQLLDNGGKQGRMVAPFGQSSVEGSSSNR
ncbi:Putative glycosyltransferase EpsH [Rhodobacteraceae bacterium THAF1]|uniref:glycosyltransferase family 2 protein n=1 Tax=Palleronia sp. THAF1 TaxID=2587842 RepID=UPI000F3FDFA8|nr:glycosyltransferase [Palleronia sp. THAF1]QFU10365.1 Putative glycosyltransferase EpsH [Palleronia sp. THAF1]VDC31484.1 Putative glycosyltransferase EpsH [Rhodobacteraceae bacterium THAF1]